MPNHRAAVTVADKMIASALPLEASEAAQQPPSRSSPVPLGVGPGPLERFTLWRLADVIACAQAFAQIACVVAVALPPLGLVGVRLGSARAVDQDHDLGPRSFISTRSARST